MSSLGDNEVVSVRRRKLRKLEGNGRCQFVQVLCYVYSQMILKVEEVAENKF